MADLVHNFGARKGKGDASFKRATDATLEVTCKASQQPTGEFRCAGDNHFELT